MSFNCVICTIAAAANAMEKKTFFGQPNVGPPYILRTWTLRMLILPWLQSMNVFDRIVVSGEWEDGPGYDYVHVPQVYGNIGDLCLQRQAAFDHLSGRNPNDWFLYLNDDTLWDPANLTPSPLETVGVLSPSRWTRNRDPRGEQLNDGSHASSRWNDRDYVNFHGTLVKRWVSELVPWTTMPPEPKMDVAYTMSLEKAKVQWEYRPSLKVYDVELFAQPWL